MMFEESLLRTVFVPRISEKSSSIMKKCNVVVFDIKNRNLNKVNIKNSIEYLFSVDVCNIRTLNIKGKVKRTDKNNIGKRNNWKKVYVTLASGQKIDFSIKKTSH